MIGRTTPPERTCKSISKIYKRLHFLPEVDLLGGRRFDPGFKSDITVFGKNVTLTTEKDEIFQGVSVREFVFRGLAERSKWDYMMDIQVSTRFLFSTVLTHLVSLSHLSSRSAPARAVALQWCTAPGAVHSFHR